jgi:hypothetical protein
MNVGYKGCTLMNSQMMNLDRPMQAPGHFRSFLIYPYFPVKITIWYYKLPG